MTVHCDRHLPEVPILAGSCHGQSLRCWSKCQGRDWAAHCIFCCRLQMLWISLVRKVPDLKAHFLICHGETASVFQTAPGSLRKAGVSEISSDQGKLLCKGASRLWQGRNQQITFLLRPSPESLRFFEPVDSARWLKEAGKTGHKGTARSPKDLVTTETLRWAEIDPCLRIESS